MKRVLGAVALLVFTLAVSTEVSSGVSASPVQESSVEASLFDAVILIDVSGSMGRDADSAVPKAIEAARAVVGTQAATRTRVGVMEFGSAGIATGDDKAYPATTELCPLSDVDAVGIEKLRICIGKAVTRPQGVDHTDHVDAVRQALSMLDRATPQASANAVKSIILITDGRLDVSNDPSYGEARPGQSGAEISIMRNSAAQRAMDGVLSEAKNQGVQLWPVLVPGRGETDPEALDRYAAGAAAPSGCVNGELATPRHQAVGDDDYLFVFIGRVLASSVCGAVLPDAEAGATAFVKGSTSEPIEFEIPALATSASFLVDKRTPGARIEVKPPGSERWLEVTARDSIPSDSGTLRSLPSSGARLAAFAVSEPGIGRWGIRVVGAADGDTIRAIAIWSGSLGVVVSTTPNPAVPSSEMTVAIELSPERLDPGRISSEDLVRLRAEIATLRISGALRFGDPSVEVPIEGFGQSDGGSPFAFRAKMSVPAGCAGVADVKVGLGSEGSSALAGLRFSGGTGRVKCDRTADVVGATIELPKELAAGRIVPGRSGQGTIEWRSESEVFQARLVVWCLSPDSGIRFSGDGFDSPLEIKPPGDARHFVVEVDDNAKAGLYDAVIAAVRDGTDVSQQRSMACDGEVGQAVDSTRGVLQAVSVPIAIQPPGITETSEFRLGSIVLIVAFATVLLALLGIGRYRSVRSLKGLTVQITGAGDNVVPTEARPRKAPDLTSWYIGVKEDAGKLALVVGMSQSALRGCSTRYSIRRGTRGIFARDGTVVLTELGEKNRTSRVNIGGSVQIPSRLPGRITFAGK